MDYTVDAYNDADLGDIVNLLGFLQHRGRDANERYVTWKYFENPLIPDPLITLIRHGSEIVAMSGLMGMAWGGSPRQDAEVIPQIDDLIVHPDHRRRGLTVLMSERLYKDSSDRGHPAIVSMSGGNSSNAIALATGWDEVRELKRMYLVRGGQGEPLSTRIPGLRRVVSKAKGLARRLDYARIAPPSDRFVDEATESVPGTNSHITVSADADVEGMSTLATTVNRHASTRSADFLRWRLDNPDRTYRFVYWNDDQLRGYMIVGWTGLNSQRAMIIDHCCESESVFDDLLTAVSRIPSGDIELMASTLPQHETDVAHRLGFRLDPEHEFGVRRFLVYPHTNDALGQDESPILNAARSWRVDLMDTLQG